MARAIDVGIRIQVSVVLPSVRKPGKGVVITRTEDIEVVVDPTDVDTMTTILRGCLVNAQRTIPEGLMGDDDNEITEVDLKCPVCELEGQAGKPHTARGKRIIGIAGELLRRGIAVDPESALEQAKIIEKRDRQATKDARGEARQKAKRPTVKKAGKGKRA